MHILIYLNIFQAIRLSSSLLSIMLLSNNIELIAKQKNFFSDFFLFFILSRISCFHAWVTISNDTIFENGNKNIAIVSQWKD